MDKPQTPTTPNDWESFQGAPRLPFPPTLTETQIELTRAFNRLENLVYCFTQINQFRIHVEPVRTLLNAYYPYKPWELTDEVANEQAKALKLVVAFLETLIAQIKEVNNG